MAATLTTIDISEYQIDSKMDWPGLIAAGVTSVIIRLSHGHTQDKEAAAHIASAKKYNLPWHGYHFYEGSSGEVEYSASMATQLGLPSTSYLFLDFEDSDIGGDWSAQFYDFRNSWLAKGWKVGLYTGDYNYTHKGFDDDELTADGVYRWIASYSYEPANYDAWQYTSTGGLGSYTSNLDHDYDRTGKLSYVAPAVTTDPFEPPAPIAGSMVGIGFDSSPVGGDRSYGYTTDGKNFYAAITPWGFIFRQRDADRMWSLLKPKIG
ncbi:GH25 family lysozyme, partial [Lacticaseibacillus pantheris]|uniref:GH25 family lysozyme n=2 Tax=Lacticaseibacillus pantheris TaxID=171523 RepID=UPI0012E872BF